MKKILLILTAVVLLGTVGTWLVTGANRGWTKTKLAIEKTDPITGIEYPVFQKKFLPGVDFLGAGLIVAVVLGGTSLFFRSNKNNSNNQQQPN